AALADQDRATWDRAEIEEGCALVQRALVLAPPGPYALEAAIAAVHAEATRAEETDWGQIALLYDRLQVLHPSPVVALNRAVAVSMASGAEKALPMVDELAGALGAYHLWHSTRADLLRRLGRRAEARAAYRKALELAQNEAERRYLTRRLVERNQSSSSSWLPSSPFWLGLRAAKFAASSVLPLPLSTAVLVY